MSERDISNTLFPVVVTGPSGVGKGTLIGKLLEQYPNQFGFSVSHTTRNSRPGEVNGIHYHFVPKDEFEKLIGEDAFIEHANVHGNYYGTSFKAVDDIRKQNKVCILDIDVQGHRNVKASTLFFKSVFIAPPSVDDLRSRLVGRGTETEEKIATRLKNAIGELEYGNVAGHFDKTIINGANVEDTYKEFVGTFKTWFPSLGL